MLISQHARVYVWSLKNSLVSMLINFLEPISELGWRHVLEVKCILCLGTVTWNDLEFPRMRMCSRQISYLPVCRVKLLHAIIWASHCLLARLACLCGTGAQTVEPCSADWGRCCWQGCKLHTKMSFASGCHGCAQHTALGCNTWVEVHVLHAVVFLWSLLQLAW